MPQKAAPSITAPWPPRSPHEALASTPGGRERLRRIAERASPSPSPLKKSRSLSALAARSGNVRAGSNDDGDTDDDEEDDEETLQLKLEAIQAKLKLKALQKKQRRGAGESSDAENGSIDSRPASTVPDVLAASRAQSRAAMLAEGPKFRPQSQVDVQVPASPVRRTQTAQSQRSPSRILLGIDKGLKAKDVSLKRASSLRRPSATHDNQSGGYLRRAHTPAPSLGTSASQERPMSFSERLAAARTEEATRKDRQERIQKVRSKAFEVGKEEIESYKAQATEIPDIPLKEETYSREEILAGSGIRRSNTVPSQRRGTIQDAEPSSSTIAADLESVTAVQTKKKVPPSQVPEDEATSFEPYSSTHLSKRILPHNLLTRTFAGKKPYLIQDLLASVKAPDFQLPEIEQDIIVLGIIASKSEPKSHKPTPDNHGLKEKKSRFAEDEQRCKYMVVTLVDLQWQLDLFLFNSAFSRYWKLVPGTLIAILNPTVMPPPRGREATGRFSLVLNSDDDTVLEIGIARDLGFCKSIKKDGALCNSWVNRKRTEFCEFHMNAALDKHRLARQDINTGSGMGPAQKKHREKWVGGKFDKDNKKAGNYDRDTNSYFYVSRASASSLIDGEHMLPGQVAERVERGDALRRRLANEEKERAIMKQLGKAGRGAGREYMQRGKLGSSVSTMADGSSIAEQPKPPDAKTLGLLIPRGGSAKIYLSPVKRKRADSSALGSVSSSVGSTSSSKSKNNLDGTGFGWGGSLKNKLARMKDGEKLDGSAGTEKEKPIETEKDKVHLQQPARKKTRFVTERGIREAGRESLGVDLGKQGIGLGGESEDELEILM